MAETGHIYVFGDETFDYSNDLNSLVHQDNDPLVVSFFEKAYFALRSEIGHLARHDQRGFHKFSSFQELSALKVDGRVHPALDQALSCAHQLAHFISKYGQEWSYPKAANAQIIGICSGALAAAAVCCSTTFSNLLPAAVQSVVVSFRTGLRSAEAGWTVTSQEIPPGDWSMLVSRTTNEEAQHAVKDFVAKSNLPLTSQPYISAYSDTCVTISGPPSTLAQFRKSSQLAKHHTAPLSIKTPYHAPHLFNEDDVYAVLSTTSAEMWESRFAAVPTVSSADGNVTWGGDFLTLLRVAVADILIKPLRWDHICQRLSSIAKSSRGMPLVVHQIGINADSKICTALKAGGCDSPLILNKSRPLPPPASLGSVLSKPCFDRQLLSSAYGEGRPNESKIAIVGSSGRYPDAKDNAAFWKLLYEGRDVHKVVPPQHWNAETHVDPTGKSKNTSATPFGCWLDHPELFDAKFFNISPREAPQVDPAQRIALLTVYEALEQAGIVPGATPSTQKDRVGIFYGVTSNDWMETNSAQNIDAYHIPGGNRAFIPGRVNYCFNFSGPSFSIDTACSSSLASMHVACNALWRGEIDTAIAGGTNILTNPDFTAGLDRGHFLSRTGNCKTFDDDADGYCRGEGVGSIVLKRLEDAIYDGDPIQAVIAGACTNHSAEAESITRPFVDAQKDIFRKVLSSAGVDPYEIGYVEMHGTGTQAGDGSEMRSVMDVFAPDAVARKRNEAQELYIGSAKANIGHGEAASGVSSLIKVLLMMEANTIPPHCGIKGKINHTFPKNLDERRVFIANQPTPWKKSRNHVRKVFINNFSAAGGNTALLLEDAPTVSIDETDDCRSHHVVAVSAKSGTSLQGNLASMISSLSDTRPEDLPQLSWTTTARRMHHQHRVMAYGSDIDSIRTRLQQALENNEGSKRPASAPKISFVFTGQGSGYAGMGRDLFEESSVFRRDLKRFDMMAQSLEYPPFLPFLLGNGGQISEPTTIVSQLAIVCLEMALARLWISWGMIPESTVGQSLGEFAALNVAGVLSDSDTIHLAGKRAQLLQEHCLPNTHSMLAVGPGLKPSSNAITKILKGKAYEVACVNSPEQFVISGNVSEIRGSQQRLADSNIKATILDVPYAFHSAQVEPILAKFKDAAQAVPFHRPSVPVLNTLDANVVREEGVINAEHLTQHCRKTVDLVGALSAAKTEGLITDKTLFLELGPHPIVSDMIKPILPSAITLPSLKRKTDARQVIAKTMSSLYVAGFDINWREYHRDFTSCQKVLRLPSYSWDLKPYWMQYVNDWSLRKGDPLPINSNPQPTFAVQNVSQKEETPIESEPTLLQSSTIHEVVEQRFDGRDGLLKIRSDISRPDLNPLVQGHKVNGIPLCTPSVYAEIALSLGDFLKKRDWSSTKACGVAVTDMVIEKALIAAPRGPQILEVSAELVGVNREAKCTFSTIDSKSNKALKHAMCKIQFTTALETKQITAGAPEVSAQIKRLRKLLESHKAYVFNKSMIYKMVATLADFDPKYRALDEIVLDSDGMAAASLASFGGIKSDGTYHTNPAYIDALSQSAGFVMNANDKSNLDVEVFVNHGWESFQLFERLSSDKIYQSHVSMTEKPGKMWQGDLFVIDGDRAVALFKGIKLQGVPKRLLHYILSTESTAQANTPKSKSPVGASQTTSAKPQKPVAEQPNVTVTEKKPAPVPPVPETTTLKPKTEAPTNRSTKLISKALNIVSEESGIGAEDLVDGAVFDDIGIDSLLGLMIASRLRDELAVDIDSSILHSLYTIEGLKDFLGHDKSDVATAQESPPANENTPPIQISPQIQSLPSDEENTALAEQGRGEIPQGEVIEIGKSMIEGVFGRVAGIIAEESGIEVDDLKEETVFTDVGIDSLLSLMICSRLSDELGIQAATDHTLFTNCNTMRELRQLLSLDDTVGESIKADIAAMPDTTGTTGTTSPSLSSDDSDLTTTNGDNRTPSSEFDSLSMSEEKPLEIVNPLLRKATSVILQGRPWVCKKTLFLFPDGAGSASSYSDLPRMHPDLAVIALNCPFVRHPQEMTCSLDVLVQGYLDELKRRQPSGSYHLGGWSAGGILAYRAAQVLLQRGDTVESLVLIDSPVPKGLDRLPKRFYDHLSTINLFGKSMPGADSGPPAQLLAHFNATIDVLHDYHAQPIPAGSLQRATIIWAAECVIDGVILPKLPPHPDDTEGMKFLSEPRSDFSAQGWGNLFPGAKVNVSRVEDAHQFSMMHHMPQAQETSRIISNAVGLS